MLKYFILFLSLIHLCADCGSSNEPARPMEKYNVIPVENEASVLNIPVRIDKNELQKQVNAQLTGDFYKDDDMSDDGLMVTAAKGGDIELELHEDEIFYRVPVNLQITKSLAVTNAYANGSIVLVFRTAYEIKRNWALETRTEVTEYRWTDKPRLKVGFVNIPVENIANLVLRRAENQLTRTIDEQVKKNLDLTKTLNDTWVQLHRPVEVSPDYRTWLLPNPQNLSLTRLKIDGDTLETNILVAVRPQISIGAQPETPLASELPAFNFSDDLENEEFRLKITTEIPFEEAEQIALTGLKGQSFSQGSRTVTIQDIEIYGQGDKLVIGTETTGAYNGKIYLKGRPEFSEKRNRIELEDVDFDFSSKSFLLGSLAWIFKGKFKSLVQENIDFQLGYNLEMTKAQIADELQGKVLAPGVTLNGSVKDLAVSKVYITQEAIRLTVILEGDVAVNVGDLNKVLEE